MGCELLRGGRRRGESRMERPTRRCWTLWTLDSGVGTGGVDGRRRQDNQGRPWPTPPLPRHHDLPTRSAVATISYSRPGRGVARPWPVSLSGTWGAPGVTTLAGSAAGGTHKWVHHVKEVYMFTLTSAKGVVRLLIKVDLISGLRLFVLNFVISSFVFLY